MTQGVDGRGLSEVDTFSKVDERGLSEVGELSGDDGLPGPPPASTVALSGFSGLRTPITQRSSPRGARDPSDPGTIEPRAMGTRCPAPTTQRSEERRVGKDKRYSDALHDYHIMRMDQGT